MTRSGSDPILRLPSGCEERPLATFLGEIFPEVPRGQVDQHYRARLLYRGALPKESGGRVIPEQILREEEARGFCRRGLYLRQLRYFTDGLVVGSEEGVREWITLGEIFPEVPRGQVDQHYRARLLYRGALPKESGGRVIPEQILREEEARGFCRRGLYLRQLRYFTDGLVVGSEEGVREWITRLRRQGSYLRRLTPSFTEDSPVLGNSVPLLFIRVPEGDTFRRKVSQPIELYQGPPHDMRID